MEDAVRAVDLSKTYGIGPAAVKALDHVSLTIARGMVAAWRLVAGDAVADRIVFRHAPAIDRIVRTWPRDFDAKVGHALGMRTDAGFEAIVRQYVDHDMPR